MFTRSRGIAFKYGTQVACGIGLASRLAGPTGRSITKAVVQIGSKLTPSPKAAALVISLVLSALLTAAILRLPDQRWLFWISFLPLFVVVRSLRPPVAVLTGGFWGGCLYVFSTVGPTPSADMLAPSIDPSARLFTLLIVIPAVYVGLAARPARAIGFKLLTLALGWTLIEVALATIYTNTRERRTVWHSDVSAARAVLPHQDYSHSVHPGLLTGSPGDNRHLHWPARLIGYVCTAFVVACANASLVSFLSGARLRLPTCRSLAGSPSALGCPPPPVLRTIQSWALRQAHPRAPPIRVAVPNWIVVGSAHPIKTHNNDVPNGRQSPPMRFLIVNAW